ncbi:Small ribosomal subunit protein uS5 [Entamoeba marina]
MEAAKRPAEKRQFGQKRGNAKGGRGAPRRGQRQGQGDTWTPVTKLGRLVKDGRYERRSYDSQSVQKQTAAGQRTRMKAYVAIGDRNGHVGLGAKCAKDVAGAIRGAMIQAKLGLIPVRRGYWGATIGNVHTIPCKLTGACGSVRVRLVPAPRGSGLVAAKTPKKFLELAGIEDCFTQSSGHTKTLGNFVKATFEAVRQSYSFQTQDMWKTPVSRISPMDRYAEYLAEYKKK